MRAKFFTPSWRLPFLCLLGLSLAIFFLAGCGSSSSGSSSSGGGSSSGGTSLYTKVLFHFEGYQASAKASASAKLLGRVMPEGTTQVRFSGYDANKKLLYGPQIYAAAENITLTDVNVSVSDFLVEYLTSSSQVLALKHSGVALKTGTETTVTLSDYSPIKDTVESFTVEPSAATAIKGYGLQFTANLLLKDAYLAPVTVDSSWTSSDEAVAAFNDSAAKGYASALSGGSSQITAQYAGLSATSELTVTEAVASVLEVVPQTTAMYLGQEQQLALNCVFSDGTRSDITKQATWQSSASSVASINPVGLLKALAPGSTVITATDKVSGQSAQCTIEVSTAKLAKVTLQVLKGSDFVTDASLDTYVGARFALRAQGQFDDSTVQDVTSLVTWTIDKPDAVQALGTTGAFAASQEAEAVHVKIASIEASISQVAEMEYANNDITVKITAARLQSLTLTCEGSWSAPAGDYKRQLTATGHFSDTTTQDVTSSVTWVTKGDSGITVSNETESKGLLTTGTPATPPVVGKVYATGLDSAGQTVTSQDYDFTTTAAIVKSISISYDEDKKTADFSLAKGLTKQFEASATLSDGTAEDITKLVTWQSTPSNIFDEVPTTDTSGLYKAMDTGVANVSATFINSEEETVDSDNQIEATVTAAELVSFAVTPDQAAIKVGETQQYTASVTYTDASTKAVTDGVTWESSLPIKASVNVSGLVTALQETENGTPVVVTASYQGKTATAQLVVTNMSKFTVNNVYYSGVSGTLTAKVIALDSSNTEYECPSTLVIPASEAADEKINLDVYATLTKATDKIKSVTFYNTTTGHDKFAFEWWDEEAGQAYQEGLTLDIATNDFAGGAGTSDNYYLVTNPRQLDNVRNNLNKYFKQTRDIDFENSCGMSATLNADKSITFTDLNTSARYYNGGDGWMPIGREHDSSFSRTYNGQSHSIERMMISVKNSTSTINAGLFNRVEYATISGIIISDTCYIVAGNATETKRNDRGDIGSIAGYTYDSTISDCINKSSISLAGYTGGGGITGEGCGAIINNCSNEGSIFGIAGSTDIGGIAGYVRGCTISNCRNIGPISGTAIGTIAGSYACVGGIVSSYDGSDISDCSNAGSISGTTTSIFSECYPYVGGIVGVCVIDPTGFVRRCINVGPVSGTSIIGSYVSGIAGYNTSCTISDCSNVDSVSGISTKNYSYVGGITGYSTEGASISNAYSAGKLTSTGKDASLTYVGGILGSSTGTLTNTFYLEGMGATKGRSGEDDVAGECQKLTSDQLKNVAYLKDTETYLWQALNATRTGDDAPWVKNTTGIATIDFPLNYPILKVFTTTP